MLLLMALAVLLVGLASNFISVKATKKVMKPGNSYTILIRFLFFVASFLIIGWVVALLLIYNIRIER